MGVFVFLAIKTLTNMTTVNTIAKDIMNGFFTGRRTEAAQENRLFYDGDHLQKEYDYRGWIGERPRLGSSYGDYMSRVEEAFVSRNVIKEGADRHDAGILGREPLWRFLSKTTQSKDLTEPQQKLVKEAEDALTEWYNERNILGIFQQSDITAILEGKAIIRPYIKAKAVDKKNGKLKKQISLADALKLLRFEVITADKGGVFEDDETFEDFGVYAYEDKDGNKKAEITYLDDEGKTRLRKIDARDISDFVPNNFPTSLGKYISEADLNKFKPNEMAMELGGRLFMYEVDRVPLISEQVRQLSKSLNLTLTMMMRNINVAGARTTTVSNAKKPTETTTYTDAQGNPTRETKEVPVKRGVGTTLFLNGLPVYSEDGKSIVGYTSPNINVQDPVSVENFIKSLIEFYEAILTELNQLHVSISGDATASGRSRQEARAEFEKSLVKTKTLIDALGRWLIEVALRFAAFLCGRPEFLEFRCDFNSIVDAGIPSAEERAANREDYKEGVICKETLQSRNGVDVTDAENAKISADPESELNRLDKALDVINKGVMVFTMEEQRRILYPHKTDAEITADLVKLAQENPAIQGGLGV